MGNGEQLEKKTKEEGNEEKQEEKKRDSHHRDASTKQTELLLRYSPLSRPFPFFAQPTTCPPEHMRPYVQPYAMPLGRVPNKPSKDPYAFFCEMGDLLSPFNSRESTTFSSSSPHPSYPLIWHLSTYPFEFQLFDFIASYLASPMSAPFTTITGRRRTSLRTPGI